MINLIFTGITMTVGGIIQIIIGIVLGIIFVFLSKRKEILAILGSGFIIIGIIQIVFGILIGAVSSYVN